jgi:hypothetical protein
MTGVGVIAALALAGWAAGFVLGGATPRTASPPPASTPAPQTVVRPPVNATVTSAREGDGIRFSWTYDNRQPGDWYRVERTDVEDSEPQDVFEPTIFIADDEACVEVLIFRATGTGGAVPVSCFP